MTTLENPEFPGVLDVSPQDVFAEISNLTLIDVREPEEFSGELGHIEGAKLIPLGELENRIKEIPTKRKLFLFAEVEDDLQKPH